jgi:hypothetical protein
LGPRTALTRQPVSGRANDGGLRIGEMERDVLISHGITDFLRESMMERGDKYRAAVCNNTGMFAIYNSSKDLFISPMLDGPIRFIDVLSSSNLPENTRSGENVNMPSQDNSFNVENITRFGRDFSIVSIPYSLKLLIQELQTMNIQMRIITEENIECMENMSFSNNLAKLTHIKNVTMSETIVDIRQNLIFKNEEDLRKNRKIKPNFVLEEELKEEEFEIYSPHTPSMSPTEDAINGFPHTPSMSPPDSVNSRHTPSMSPPDDMDIYSSSRQQDQNNFSALRSEKFIFDSGDASTKNVKMPSQNIFKQNAGKKEKPNHLDASEGNMNSSYEVGQDVLLRGMKDGYPNRVWKIKKIGESFYTVETDDVQGLSSRSDSIRIVSPMDICALKEVRYAKPYQPNNEIITLSSQPPPHPPMQAFGAVAPAAMSPRFQPNPYNGFQGEPFSSPPNISVNPIIKIVNGPDHSNGGFPPSTNNEMYFNGGENNESLNLASQEITTNIPYSGGGTNNISIQKTPETPSVSKEQFTATDFMNGGQAIVIKKLGS